LTPVSLKPDRVTVSGRVTLNGHPLPNVDLGFIAEGRVAADDLIRTDENGFYELSLPAPGRYDVWFERDGIAMLGNEREVTLSAGANDIDFDLQGATLKLQLKEWTRRAAVEISVKHVWMPKPGKVGNTLRVLPTDALPIVFHGLSYGRYAVQAREHVATDQAGNRAAGATVTLVEAQPETEVELVLTDTVGTVRVFDPVGVPVVDALVKAGEDRLIQTAPGMFSLGNVVPSTTVLVTAAGFTPVLRLVPNESPFDVVLTRGKPVRLRFVGGSPPIAKGSLTWPGTDTPVPLHLFTVTRSSGGSGDFIVHDFPAVPGVIYIPGPFDPPDRYQPVTTDANGVVRVRGGS
jgi:hypothetical protein